METLIFGWVADNINNNFAAWSTNKSEGTKEDADKFYADTVEEMEGTGMSWFCVDKD